MKKMSKFLKMLASATCSLIMVFSLVFVSKDVRSMKVNAETYTNDYYTLSYENNEVKLLLNSQLSVFENFTSADLDELQSNIMSVFYSAILDDVDISATSTRSLKSRAKKEAPSLTGANVDVSLVEDIIKGQLTNYEAIDYALSSEGTYDVLIEFYVDRYTETYVASNPTVSAEQVYSEITTSLVSTIQTVVNEVYEANGELEYAPNVSTKIESLVETVKDTNENGGEIEISLGDVVGIIKTVDDSSTIVNIINELDVSTEIKDIVKNSQPEEVVEFFNNVEMDTVVDVFTSVSFESQDVKDMISSIGGENLIGIVENVGMDNIKKLADAVNMTREDLEEVIKDSVSDITMPTLLKMIKTIKINGVNFFSNNQVQSAGFNAIIKSIPSLSEIAKLADEDMNVSWNVGIETSLGNVEFKLTVGFKGDCSSIRNFAEQITKLINVTVNDGVYNITIKTPESLNEVLLRLSNSGELGDDIKHELFDTAFADIEGIYQSITDKSLNEYIELLKDVDYKTITANFYNAESLNDLFDTDTFTDEKLDSFVDSVFGLVSKASTLSYDEIKAFVSGYVDISRLDNTAVESLINRTIAVLKSIDAKSIDSALIREFIDPNSKYTNENIYNYLDQLSNYQPYFDKIMSYITKIYESLPNSAKDNKLMDYYQGNGSFYYSGKLSIDIEQILTSISGDYGQKIYEGLSIILDKIPSSIDVTLSLDINEVYEVKYNIGTEVKSGVLPVGADVDFFANVEDINGYPILKWIDAEGNTYTTMPAKDIELFAVTEFSVEINDGISKVYDAEPYVLEVTTDPTNLSYTYQWYKDGQVIEGADTYQYSVVNVSDSGTYYCVVSTETSFNTSSEVTVAITPIQFDASTLTWDYTTAYTYDGVEKTVTLSNVPEYVDVTYYNNTAIDASTYTATAIVSSLDTNYEVFNTVTPLSWTINKVAIDVSGLTWDYTTAFTYDGSAKEVELSSLPANVSATYTDNNKTDAGTYTASVVLSTTNANYEITGQVGTLTWTINKVAIDVSSLTWDYTTAFTYDGNAKEVELSSLPANVSATYTDNNKTDAGTYTASVVLSTTNTNYEITGQVGTLTWTINKAAVDVSSLTWDYTTAFTYDGSAKEVELSSLPANVSATYTDNNKTDAGTYTASVVLSTTNTNYEITGQVGTLTWTINKAAVDVSSLTWDYTTAFTYDGSAKEVELSSLPAGVGATYTNNIQTNAGTYTATVTFSPANTNYEVTGQVDSLTWTINKASIDLSELSWNYTKPFAYDGSEKTVTLNNVPEQISVTYTNNSKIAAGNYTASATAISISNNHEVVGSIASLSWSINQTEYSYGPSGDAEVIVNAQEGVDPSNGLDVSDKTDDHKDEGYTLGKDDLSVGKVYDINFVDGNGNVVTLDGTFTVKLLIPEQLRESENLKVIHIADDGTITDMNARREGNYMVFETTHFSQYAIVEVLPQETSNWWIWLLVALIILILIILLILLLRRRKPVVVPVVEQTNSSYITVRYEQENRVVEQVKLEEMKDTDTIKADLYEYVVGKVNENSKEVSIQVFKDVRPLKIVVGKENEGENTSNEERKVICKDGTKVTPIYSNGKLIGEERTDINGCKVVIFKEEK